MIPAVVYGRQLASRPVVLDGAAFKKALAAGFNVLLDLQIKGENGSPTETVMVKELQRHPIQKDNILHVDLMRISLKEKVEVKVPLNFTGEPRGVKEGGIFQVQMREVGIRCFPADIPEHINIPVNELQIGDVLTVAELKLPVELEIMEEEAEIIASVLAPHAEAAVAPEEEEKPLEEQEEEKPEA